MKKILVLFPDERDRATGDAPPLASGCGRARHAASFVLRTFEGALARYVPQARSLALISTGNRYAVASRGALALGGAWTWYWKDWIDRRFMRRYATL